MASTFSFSIIPSEVAQFGPRLGSISLCRRDGSSIPEIKTPGFIAGCSRGVVPHLSRDHVKSTAAIRWANIPFESFLERLPPVPTLQTGPVPLHTFLGFQPDRHLLSLCAREPSDEREIPVNGKGFISTLCVRGVRKLTPSAWKSYALSCQPDIVVALSDNPLSQSNQSQKRVTKSLERSTAWLANLLGPVSSVDHGYPDTSHPFNVLVNMVGGVEERARKAFAEALVESLYSKDQQQIHPLQRLDEGITGYVFESIPLLRSIRARTVNNDRTNNASSKLPLKSIGVSLDNEENQQLVALFKASLSPLPHTKVRVVYSCMTPHQILRLIRDIGIDLFDAPFAHRAADIGIALDFRFPIPSTYSPSSPRTREDGSRDLGHNLFNYAYATDSSRLASSFNAAAEVEKGENPICPCLACSPISPSSHLELSSAEDQEFVKSPPVVQLPYRRAYIHHLLHTHEMSSHSLLAMHNLSVIDAFFDGIRQVLGSPNGNEQFIKEVERFCTTYDEQLEVFREADVDWSRVELERGKGRLAREKEKQAQNDTTLTVPL